MVWIVKLINDGRYIYTKNAFVKSPEFARRFNSRDQALAYMKSGEFSKSECELIKYSPSTIGVDEILEMLSK